MVLFNSITYISSVTPSIDKIVLTVRYLKSTIRHEGLD